MKVYILTIAYNDETEEIEYISEEVQEDAATTLTYGSVEVTDWEGITSEEAVELMKDIAEA